MSVEDDVAAAALGDRQAFERVYRAHVNRVFALCVRMLGDRVQAEEVTQDVFVRVWEKLPGFRGDAAFSTWVHRVAVNVVLSRRKAAGIQHARSTDDPKAQEMAVSRPVSVGDRLDWSRPSPDCRTAHDGSSCCTMWKGSRMKRSVIGSASRRAEARHSCTGRACCSGRR